MNDAPLVESLPTDARRALMLKALALGWIAGCVSLLWYRGLVHDARLSPFASLDLAITSLLCVIPLGVILVHIAARWLDGLSFLSVGLCCWTISLGLLGLVSLQGHWSGFAFTGALGYATRPMAALALTWPTCWLWTFSNPPDAHARKWPWLLVTLGLATCLPATYVIARCRQDVTRCQELLTQSRIGEAAIILQRLRVLAPGAQILGQPITHVALTADRSVRQLELAVAQTPSPKAPNEAWLQRARQFAMLGDTDAALSALAVIPNPGAEAQLLAGTIHETREEWRLAWQDYTDANDQWFTSTPSEARTAGRIRATRGIAYCLRKQGRYPEAERAYHQLLELSPTADSHFLLAQFYEDTQQTTLAKLHVRQAMDLAPERYGQSGQQLINKLAATHFGCFSLSEK